MSGFDWDAHYEWQKERREKRANKQPHSNGQIVIKCDASAKGCSPWFGELLTLESATRLYLSGRLDHPGNLAFEKRCVAFVINRLVQQGINEVQS